MMTRLMKNCDIRASTMQERIVTKLFEPGIPPKGWQKRILRSAWGLANRNQTGWVTVLIVALPICVLFGLLE